jgi:aspartate/glutamate racemase
MRLFGLIGGLAPASTAEYYQTINTEVRRRLGGQHTATLLIWSCDQQEYIVRRQHVCSSHSRSSLQRFTHAAVCL